MPIVDFYEELAQTRCLSLDSEELRSKFQELSKKHHPDAGGHVESFAQINQAHQTLSNPASRIGHLSLLQKPMDTDQNLLYAMVLLE